MAVVARRRDQNNIVLEHADPKKKGDFAHEAVEGVTKAHAKLEEARRMCDHECDGCHSAEEVSNEARQNVLKKAEMLEKDWRTVTMRAESLALTEDDINKTVSEEHDVAQVRMNLAAQLSATVPFLRPLRELLDPASRNVNKRAQPPSANVRSYVK